MLLRSPNLSSKKLVAIALVVLVAFSFGCGKVERAPEKAAKATAAPTGEKSFALPDEFPKDVPILKNATIKVVMSQGNRTTVHLYTTSSVGDAVKFYDDAFRRQGWQIQDETKGNEMSILSARKGTSLCGVTMSKQGTGTLIRLALSQTGSHTVQ